MFIQILINYNQRENRLLLFLNDAIYNPFRGDGVTRPRVCSLRISSITLLHVTLARGRLHSVSLRISSITLLHVTLGVDYTVSVSVYNTTATELWYYLQSNCLLPTRIDTKSDKRSVQYATHWFFLFLFV